MGRHAKNGPSAGRGHLRIAVIVGAVCVVAGGTAAAVTAGRSGHPADSGAPACKGGTVEVAVRADPSATSWLSKLADRYAGEHHRVDGRCVVPKVSSLAYSAASTVVRPTPYPGSGAAPDVWVPDSSSVLDLFRSQTDAAQVLPMTTRPIATSPLVLAAPEKTVTQWQQDGADGDLDALLDLDGGDSSRLSVPDPATTGTGIAAVLAAAAKTTRAAVDGSTFNTEAARLGLIRLGSRTSTVATDGTSLLSKVGGSASADNLVAVAEHDVWQYNKTHRAHPLDSFNAFGAALAVDYPYVPINGSWVTNRIRTASTDFGSWLTSSATQGSLTEFGLRQADGSAGGLSGPGIDGAHGRLDPAPPADPVVAAHSAWTLLTTRRSVLSLIDVSASMSSAVPGTTQSKLQLARSTASDALQYFTDDDQLGLSEFSTTLDGTPASYKALVPLAAVGTSGSAEDRRAALTTAYQHLRPQHGTALYDAVLSAYADAQQHFLLDAVNVVVVLTDGDDANSKLSLAALLSELRKRQSPAQPVHIVTIAYGADANEPVLRQIAAATGGASFSAKDPRSIGTVFISALAAVDR